MQLSDSSPVNAQLGRKARSVILLMALIIVLLLGACGYLFIRYRTVGISSADNDKQQQVAVITKELSSRITLPGEQAILATILDKRKLNDAQLAIEAQNGDTLLIYPKAKRVFLYRPSTHKLVDIFRVQDTAGATTGTSSSTN